MLLYTPHAILPNALVHDFLLSKKCQGKQVVKVFRHNIMPSQLFFLLLYDIRSQTKNNTDMENNLLSLMETRRSVRAFDAEKTVPETLIQQVVRAGEYAPTGHGAQSPRIVVITNEAVREQLSHLNAQVMGVKSDPFYHAPVYILVLADKSCPTYVYDGSLVLGNMMNAAHALGLGSCWIHRAKEVFAMPEGKDLLKSWGIEGDYEGIGHLALGYAAKPAHEAKPRKEDYTVWVR